MSGTVSGTVRGPGPRREGGTTLVAALLLALAAAAVVLAAGMDPEVPGPGAASARPDPTPVERTLLGCPSTASVSGEEMTGTATVGLAPLPDLPGAAGQTGAGAVRVGAIGDRGEVLGLARGELADVDAGPAPVLDARGRAARGIFAHRADRASGSIAGTPCPSPRGSWWFVGAGAGLDHVSDLVVANLDPGPAVLDVRVLGPDGPVETLGTRDIPLPPGEVVTLPLADVAPLTDELAVAVGTSRGRVVAAVLDRFTTPSGGSGLDWLPGTDRPARSLVLAGLPARAAARTLVVANPADRQARVEVEVAGAGGSFVPAGLDELSVAPGSVETLDLSDAVPRGEPAAVRVRSTVPLLATVRSVGPGDIGYAGPVGALDAPAAAPVLPGASSSVLLTAGEERAAADVVAHGSDGQVTGRQRVRVGARATAGWQPAAGSAYVVVVPVTGSVRGAVVHTGAGGLTQVPLTPLPLTVPTPRVVPGPR